ncbi:phenylalanine--tRNA ligase subunit beta [Psychrobacter sp. FDAARGOS_221]|uniref:phenylalanine--tRNA ligase subunit beta n=1 Tax=Psychrobacter sp. FDAARGOS_221 TaxID=1975705 RepID=UPI000BB59AED|nr:phenylalanine--tRNA ligase subunit beta [Psychrobacter sp. FDAARGOS_221]PNK60686.1 phenylalanine--tRNA ligase subunit beta [Psychrobacter sp. FDAARGOS_221]
MKISEQWLREWVNPNNNTEQLADQLTMAGLEIDDIEAVAADFSGVVVGEVISVEPHPDADKLRVTQVNINGEAPLQIVCGAPNVRVGMRAPVATIGAKLPTEDGKGFKIKKSKLRGVESQGMLCGASEIDLPDVVDGLLELPDDAPVGTDIREYLGLDNKILDISITPNRGDCFSVRGIAREIAVINAMSCTAPDIQSQQAEVDASQAVKVVATDACPRYLAQPVLNIDRQVETPDWMQKALLQSGQRLHNFLVDVTNYVLLELGQPLHAFDADKIVGDIQVRLANEGESVELLNEQTVTLKGDELVIADDEGILALAGIMGGMRSSVTDETTNIVLESAFFSPLAIAGRARRFGLHTDASQRFERGVDFELPLTALNRAVNLISDVAHGQAGQITTVESTDKLPSRQTVNLPLNKVAEVIGIDIDKDRIVKILTALEIEVTETEKDDQVVLSCVPPSHRYDIEIKEDLIEEIARIYGYDNIPSTLPKLGVDMRYDDTADLTHRLKLSMVDAGYMEAISFSFSDEKIEKVLDDRKLGNLLALANPISSDLAVMRRTLLSSLIPCVQYNLNRQQSRVRFFETGLSFVGATVSELVQTPSLAIVATGDAYPEQAHANRAMDFFDLKRDIEQLLPLAVDDSRIRYQRSDLAFLHPGQSATLLIDDVAVGWLGQLHPSVAQQLDLPTTWVAQLSLAPILKEARALQAVQSLSKFPQVRRDIALLVDAEIPRQALSDTIRKAGGTLLQQHWLFDVYQGEHTPDGKRSVAFALIWQDVAQTLSDDVVNKVMDQVIQALESERGAQLRDS